MRTTRDPRRANGTATTTRRHPVLRLPRVNGADIELGNFILGREDAAGTGPAASRAVLDKIPGILADGGARRARLPRIYDRRFDAAVHYGGTPVESADSAPLEYGRRFLTTNGASCYCDMSHTELCLPEVVSAYDHVAATHAMLRIAREALSRANYDLPVGQEIKLLVNNSDGRSNSYGSHLNFLVERRTWDDLFRRKPHYLLFLASHQVSSIVFTGQGKVGSENDRPWVDYQLSQRADFFEMLCAPQTTHARPIVNSRDEALCGRSPRRESTPFARLHCIFFDSTLAHVATLLKVGTMQIVLTMIEAGVVPLIPLLDDPVSAVLAWSHDVTLRTRCRLASGKRVTAIELQLMIFEKAKKFAETGCLDGIVPRANEILDLWGRTLAALEAHDWDALAGKLDWVLKLRAIEAIRERRPSFDWHGPEARYLDQIYSSVDASEGLYWRYEAAGIVDRLVGDAEVERFVDSPPEDTRAWTRAMLLRAAREDEITMIDWDCIRFDLSRRGLEGGELTVHLADPTRFGRADSCDAFDGGTDLVEILRFIALRHATDASSRTGTAAGSEPADSSTEEPYH